MENLMLRFVQSYQSPQFSTVLRTPISRAFVL